MNLVRLGMIVTLGVIAWYALSIYAALPPDPIPEPVLRNIEVSCKYANSGVGAIIVACVSLGGALVVAGVDLMRRVY